MLFMIFKSILAFILAISLLFVIVSTLFLFGFKTFNSAFNKLIEHEPIYNIKVVLFNMILVSISIALIFIESTIVKFIINKAQPTIQDIEICIGCNFMFAIINLIIFKLSTKILNYKFKKTKMYLSYTTANKVKLKNKLINKNNKIKQRNYNVNKRNVG